MTDNKDNRVRTPQEQRGNFLGNMGGMMKIGPEERALVAQFADVLTAIADLKKPALLARICGNAMKEWGDVSSANPAHAKDLALQVANVARGTPNTIRQIVTQTPLADPEFERKTRNARLQAQYEVDRQARGLIVPQIGTSEESAAPKPKPVMRPPTRHP